VNGSKGVAKIPNGNVPATDSTSPGNWLLMLICARVIKPPSKSSMSVSVSEMGTGVLSLVTSAR
jgi:hypothetical protein